MAESALLKLDPEEIRRRARNRGPVVPLEALEGVCRDLRCDIVRMIARAGSGHPGGSLSIVEILVTLFTQRMRFDPQDPEWPERDRLVLSKGHGVPALYAMLAHLGYFPRETLWTLRKSGSPLQGHPARALLPAVEASTGSLGQGLSIAQGMAIAARMDGLDRRIFCVLGDGEIQEGQVWEAAMSAPKWKLGHLVAILDYNKGQLDGMTRDIMDIEPVVAKWRAFNWHVLEVDGHDPGALLGAVDEALAEGERPSLVVAHTVKGKGVSFMEYNVAWHGKAPNAEQTAQALAELGCPDEKTGGER